MIRLFRPGDRVQLKVGGPVMEVMKYVTVDNEVSSTQVECAWYDPDEGRKTRIFHQNSLLKTNWSKTRPLTKARDNIMSIDGNRPTANKISNAAKKINENEDKPDGRFDNLLDTLSFIRQQGFSKEFIAVEEGLKEINGQNVYKPRELKIVKAFRFEGLSDVDDMAVLYAIQTNDGLKGWISDAYGTYANPHLSELLNSDKVS